MTHEEQRQFDQLREQLDSARKSEERVRGCLSIAFGKLTCELRLYRGLFWGLMAFSTVALIVNILRH